ncbi:hypothetical protein D0T87_00215 [Bacteroides sp. 51]|nr:hypothetical protein [Bacteroides sp. 51]
MYVGHAFPPRSGIRNEPAIETRGIIEEGFIWFIFNTRMLDASSDTRVLAEKIQSTILIYPMNKGFE